MKGSKNQRKPGTRLMSRGKKSPRNKKASDGKIKSSSALEYLMQRESQITNMLKGLEEEEKEQGDGWIRNEENEKPNEVAPDKKLKTSEGQQPHGSFCSPPDTPKASSDSNSIQTRTMALSELSRQERKRSLKSCSQAVRPTKRTRTSQSTNQLPQAEQTRGRRETTASVTATPSGPDSPDLCPMPHTKRAILANLGAGEEIAVMVGWT